MKTIYMGDKVVSWNIQSDKYAYIQIFQLLAVNKTGNKWASSERVAASNIGKELCSILANSDLGQKFCNTDDEKK